MNTHFKHAEKLIKDAVTDLESVLGKDKENISCFNPIALDSAIANLIEARSHMAVGAEVLIHNQPIKRTKPLI